MDFKIAVAVTGSKWFDPLRPQPKLSEANFSSPPSPKHLKALKPGELFLSSAHWLTPAWSDLPVAEAAVEAG